MKKRTQQLLTENKTVQVDSKKLDLYRIDLEIKFKKLNIPYYTSRVQTLRKPDINIIFPF